MSGWRSYCASRSSIESIVNEQLCTVANDIESTQNRRIELHTKTRMSSMNKIFQLGSIALMCALQAGCASMSYEAIPGHAQETRGQLQATVQRVCEVLPQAATSLTLRIDSLTTLPIGCVAEARRDAPWWMPGDDGERLRVRVVQSQDSQNSTTVEIHAKKAAAGQVWVSSKAQDLLTRLGDLAVKTH